ncbi:MAG TPA: hypothetical protein ENN40_11345 [Candidatus Aminicenantes bacterium]|nr:hypothetical protein [Candidatus Aminicenantes bacterium]
MNKRIFVVGYCFVLMLVFLFSLQVLAVNPNYCGDNALYAAGSFCDFYRATIGMECLFPQKFYGACIGGGMFNDPICHSIWRIRCEDGKVYTHYDCYAYDPLCYFH